MTVYVGDETLSDPVIGGVPINSIQIGTPDGLMELWRREMEWAELTFVGAPIPGSAPPWAAWLDIVVLGAGGGGSGGNNANANGNGGSAGRWAHSTFDMIPGRDVQFSIGKGGAGGAGGNAGAGQRGGDTVVSTSFNGWSVTGLGGNGGTGTGGASGAGPAVWTAYGRQFTGGKYQEATEAAGNSPGGGGGPGKGASIFGAKAGGPGADGRIWIRWRSY